MNTSTIKCKILAVENDTLGYQTIVCKNLDPAPFGHNYVMITRLPNWQSREVDIDEVGYITYNEVKAGEDKWFCPETGQYIPYNYTNIYFIKFVKEQDNSKKDIYI